MKNTFLLLLLSTLFSTGLFAQDANGRLEGRVVDPEGSPLPFATVLLYHNADSSLAKAGYTDDDGRYILFPLDAGAYHLRVTFTEMAPYASEVFTLAADQTLKKDQIGLQEVETEIEGVQITAEKPVITVMAGKTVFNVEGSPNAVGSNAFELLRKAPGVMIDNNDNVRLMGKNGVRIYIDGKPSPLSAGDLATVLKSMQSVQIEAIEVITSPGAKYDAEGNAGIINIRLVKDKSLGANATVNLGYGYGVLSKYNGGVTGNYRNKHMNVYGSYSASLGKSWDYVNFDRRQSNVRIMQEAETERDFAFHNFRGGADFFAGENHTIGFQASGYTGEREERTTSLARISNLTTAETQSYLRSNSNNSRDMSNLNLNLNYAFDNKKGVTWNVDLDGGHFDFKNNAWQPNTYLDSTQTTVLDERNFSTVAPNQVRIRTAKADHARPLLGGSFGAGFKLAVVTTDNSFDFYQVEDEVETLDPEKSNEFSYRENVNAAYVTYSRNIKKIGLQAGLRAEQTNSLGVLTSSTATALDEVERHYLNLFPSAGISWEASPKHSLALNYSRRIDRPRYQNLNPFEFKLDELTYNRGNPFLQPQMTSNISLTHTFAQRLTTTLSYSRVNNLITDLIDTTEVTRAFQTLINVGQQEVLTANVAFPFSLTKWWSTYSTGGATYTKNFADLGDGRVIDVGRASWNIYHQSNFQLPKGISIQLAAFYYSAGLWAANFMIDDIWGLDAGVTMRFAKGRGTLKLSATDIFWGQRWSGVQDFGGLSFSADGGNESRQVKANLSWNFGNRKVKARKRKTGLEDEKGRAGQ